MSECTFLVISSFNVFAAMFLFMNGAENELQLWFFLWILPSESFIILKF